jgi:hypothetical protein
MVDGKAALTAELLDPRDAPHPVSESQGDPIAFGVVNATVATTGATNSAARRNRSTNLRRDIPSELVSLGSSAATLWVSDGFMMRISGWNQSSQDFGG